jgi:hypothetical protein
MRVDEINLIGNFVLNGLTGGISQGIGYSGSSLRWITITGSGGGGGSIGPQGSTGPSVNAASYSFGNYQILITDGNPLAPPLGLTSSESFVYTHNQSSNRENLYLATKGVNSTLGSTFSALIAAATASVLSSNFSAIISTGCSTINNSDYSAIVAGIDNTILNSCNSVIMSGSKHTITQGANNIILSGNCNSIFGGTNGVIIAGLSNSLSSPLNLSVPFYGGNNAIIGGRNNRMSAVYTSNSAIIGGCGNYIDPSVGESNNSIVIGSKNARLNDGSRNSAMIGVSDVNTFGLINGAMIGMTGIYMGGGSGTDYARKVYMQRLIVRDYTQFESFNPATVSNGTLWFDGSKMRFRTFNTNFCIDCF